MSHETEPIVIDIPDALRDLPLWFNWRWAKRVDNGIEKKFKLPCQTTGRAASSIDRHTWTTYDKAVAAVSNFDGLAIGFGHWGEPPDDYSIAGIDLDGCLADGGGLKDWAAQILARVDSYAEFSPSGKGIHILVKVGPAYLPGMKINLSETEHVEFYSNARYFTFTGNHVSGTPANLEARQTVYEALRAEYEALRPSSQRTRSVRRAEKPATADKDAERRVSLTDAELLDRAQSSGSGDAFRRLYEGDMSDYRQDHSAADMALTGRLAFWTGKDPEQMDRLFRESGLMRAKWDTRRGLSTYGEQTIEIAIQNCEDVYSGPDTSSLTFVEKLKAKRAAKVAKTQVVGETIVQGSVRDQERGEDKPAHGKKRPVADQKRETPNVAPAPVATAKSPETGVKRSSLGRVIEEDETLWDRGNRDGESSGLFGAEDGPQADLFTANGILAGPVHQGVLVQTILSESEMTDSTRAILGDIAEHWPDAVMVDVSRIVSPTYTLPDSSTTTEHRNEDSTNPEDLNRMVEALLPAIGDSSGIDEDQLPTKASEYVAQSDVDYTVVEEVEEFVEATPRVVDEVDMYELTGVGNFDRFKARYAGSLIFTRSAGWMRWNGHRWVLGNEYAGRASMSITREMHATGLYDERLTQERKTALIKHALASQRIGPLNEMEAMAAKQEPFTMYEINLDRDPMLLNAPNGIINLRTGELSPPDPSQFMTKMVAVDFEPGAQSDLWDEVIREATKGKDGLADFLQRAAGYTLTGVTSEDAVFFLHGPGGTAKSSIGEAIKAMMGSYATSMRSEALTTQGNSGHNDDIARLVGARMVITGEADKADKMRDGLFKRLSGGDTIDASRKGKTGFNFRPQFKMWFITNIVPALNPDDSGIWRRVFKLPFENVLKNPDRKVRIALQQDRDVQKAILAWAVRGAVLWYEHGLGMPTVVKEATEALRRSMDGLADFFEGRCYFNSDAQAKLYTPSKDLMEAYTEWANEEGLDARFRASQRRLGQGLSARGCAPRATRHERGWMGVILKDGGE